MIALQANNINKYFYTPDQFQVLKKISFEVNQGEFVSIIGKSGCGKSTLLYILSTMDTDYEGQLQLTQQIVTGNKQDQLAAFRNAHLGFVFQFHYLLPDFTCLRNVMIPALRLGKVSRQQIEHDAYEKLKLLGMADQALKPASKISGGQQQRVAIARALVTNPELILADEPTGNLDSKSGDEIMHIFQRLNRIGKTIIMITHEPVIARHSKKTIRLKDGEII